MDMYNEIIEQAKVISSIKEKNIKTLAGIIEGIKETNISQVVIAARGTSDHCAIYAKYLIEMLIGIPVSLSAPSVNTVYGAELKYKDALVIAISQSGMAEDALAVINNANKCGCITVAITNKADSPLATQAKFSLDCAAGLEKSVAATKTFTSSMYLCALLVAEWSKNEELTVALEKVGEGLCAEIEKANSIMEFAKQFTFMNECIVVARGLLYPIALEASLKMMETTYTSARGFALSDFQHGPLALIQDNTPVIVYCSDDATQQNVLETVERYKELGAYILMITDDEKNIANADKYIMTEKTSMYTQPLHQAVIAQLFACGLAKAKRRNPDAPRSIKKITVTK